jgi:lipoate-protein ligase A
MLFERLLVYEDRAPVSAAMNMAIDEALLEHGTCPALRFYGWRGPSLSFGYFGKFANIAPEIKDRDLVRRWTGGGSVLHDRDLTYSLITPASDLASGEGPTAIYAALHGAIRQALREDGRETELATATGPKISDACFANPVRDDLIFRGRKIAGAAQRRTRGGFLHQGSIQLPDLSKAFRDRFASALSKKIEHEEIPPQVVERAVELAVEKYGTGAWLRRW